MNLIKTILRFALVAVLALAAQTQTLCFAQSASTQNTSASTQNTSASTKDTIPAAKRTGTLITGTITAPSGDPLPYVSIYFRHDPTIGSISNEKGDFSISAVISKDDTLMFSLIGYQAISFPIATIIKGGPLKITMSEQPIMLNEAVVIAYPKESRRAQRKEMRALLDKIHNRLSVDYPVTESHYQVVSDIMILNQGQVATYDKLIGNLIELPRKGKNGSDSIRIDVSDYSNYMDSEIRKGIQSFRIESLDKNEKKAVSWATKDKAYEKTLPHRLLWKIDARRIFLMVYEEEKYWSKKEKDYKTLLLTYHKKYNFLGIVVAQMDLTMEVDNELYSINNVSHRITLNANIPFGYKLSEAELAVLNICNIQGTDLEKFKAKRIKAHVEGNVILNNIHNRMIPSEKNMISDVQMENSKGVKAAFDYQSTMKVLGFKLP